MTGLSVVIPTYRRGQVLLDTVQYLLNLPEAPQEILVVDQTEQPPPEVDAFFRDLEKTPVRRIMLPKPSIPHAMNVGLQEANGEIVLFLDDDIIPDEKLVSAHQEAHAAFPEAVAVVGQVLQPEENFETLKTETLKNSGNKISALQHFRFSAFQTSHLRRDLEFKFNSTEPTWITNVMAGNLSVKKEQAIAVGGFDENFTPPVSYRFETEFAKRLMAEGGTIRFEPAASIRHLRTGNGGTRTRGSHLTSASPLHGVGDYYYALRCGQGLERIFYIIRRPFREVATRFHLRHPWYIPIKFIGELRAMVLAVRLFRSAQQNGVGGQAKTFYHVHYAAGDYAAYSSPAEHPFYSELRGLISQYASPAGRWLEVGCGRGLLQDVVDDYTGVDLAETVADYLHKFFVCAPAEALPFPDCSFFGVWSYAVLEHVESPEQALFEVRRVLKPGGILFLSPAWQCRPWAGQDYAWKPFCELSIINRIRKALIPIRDSMIFRAFFVFSRRGLHLLGYLFRKKTVPFYSRPLIPNYSEYKIVDADARHHMDPFDAVLWFRSRGDQVLSHPNWRKAFFIRTGTIVVRVEKA